MASNNEQAEATSTPVGDPFERPLSAASSTNSQQQRATTTERRTTTTTTTKRTIKSSDDFLPMGKTEMSSTSMRSESRSGSVSGGVGEERLAHLNSGASTPTAAGSQRQTSSSSSSQSRTTTSTSTLANELTALQTPVVEDCDDGSKILKLRFDVSQYDADDIVVKTIENRLHIQAKHEEKTENRSVYREYSREFHLPEGVDVDTIKSSLSRDGILTVECSLPKMQLATPSRRIPIEKVN